jgi:hypothetical protein
MALALRIGRTDSATIPVFLPLGRTFRAVFNERDRCLERLTRSDLSLGASQSMSQGEILMSLNNAIVSLALTRERRVACELVPKVEFFQPMPAKLPPVFPLPDVWPTSWRRHA